MGMSVHSLMRTVTSTSSTNSSGGDTGNQPSEDRMNEIVDSLCADYNLKRTSRKGRHVRNCAKWTFTVEEEKTGTAGTLELYHGPIDKMRYLVRHKWLKSEHFQSFRLHSVYEPDFHCFLYETEDTIRNVVDRDQLDLGLPREQIMIGGYLQDVLAALLELNGHGLYHSRLDWDVFHIGADGQVKLGMLECAVDEDTARRANYLAQPRHMPPETLAKTRRRIKKHGDLNKIETWIIGSLLLEILIHKQMSGPEFRTAKASLTSSAALKNIKDNASELNTVLWGSNLSMRMRTLISQMLCADPESRISLNDALAQVVADAEHSDIPKQTISDSAKSKSAQLVGLFGKPSRESDSKSNKCRYCCCSVDTESQSSGDFDDRAADHDDDAQLEVKQEHMKEPEPEPETSSEDDEDVVMTASHEEQSCTLHWSNPQSPGSKGRRVRIIIAVDPKDEE